MPAADWLRKARLWLVLDRAAAAPRSLAEVTQLCLRGGVDAVLFRMKDADEAVMRAEARKVKSVCQAMDAPLVISHNAHLALDLDAEGIQLGIGDMPLAKVKEFCQGKVIGFSAHSLDEVRSVARQGADYVFLGPVFPTPSKAGMGKPLGTGIVLAATEPGIPAIMIGGISEENLPQILAAGGSRVAAIRALQSVSDPRGAAQRMKDMLLGSA